jgi:hypothetical protein
MTDTAALWATLEKERRKLDSPTLKGESAYGEAYQALVRAGAAQQLRAKYRGR